MKDRFDSDVGVILEMEMTFKQGDIELWDIRDWQEFRDMAKDGHLDLDIHSSTYPEISEKIFVRDDISLFGSYERYKKNLILAMMKNEKIFRDVLNTGGIDMYYNRKVQHYDFSS